MSTRISRNGNENDLVCHGVPGQADKYACWANTIEDVSTATLLGIKGICGGKHEFAKCLYELSGRDINDITRLLFHSEETADRITGKILQARSRTPEEEQEKLQQAGISTVCYDDPWYPDKLRDIYNPPYILYYYGKLPSSEKKSLSIIGSRMATPYGREQARVIARSMAANGIQIISGMARGIDGIAGRAALDAGGVSIAILGGGPDICYPRENEALYEDLKKEGGIISEYHPGIQPQGRFFAARNRLISAFSDAVLVVEAKEKSGTMITVDCALEQGRDVFAIPGRICDANSKGCNQLIRHGAGSITCADDLLEYFFGVGCDEVRDTISELRVHRAGILERQQQAAFMERDGRGAGYLHQMDINEIKPESVDEISTTKPVRNAGTTSGVPGTAGNSRSHDLSALSELETISLSCLDKSTPRGLEEILPEVRERMKRSVAYSEIVSCMTRLSIKRLVTEVRVGFYLAL